LTAPEVRARSPKLGFGEDALSTEAPRCNKETKHQAKLETKKKHHKAHLQQFFNNCDMTVGSRQQQRRHAFIILRLKAPVNVGGNWSA
jgi:hypothetical protein